jgi:hypothetical protein
VDDDVDGDDQKKLRNKKIGKKRNCQNHFNLEGTSNRNSQQFIFVTFITCVR